MSTFIDAHPFIFGVAIWLSLQAIAAIMKAVAVIIRGRDRSAVDLTPIENKLSAVDQKLASMDRRILSVGVVAETVLDVLRNRNGKFASPSPPTGDPLEAFKRSVSGMSGKERAEVTQRAREWMFSGVSK